MKGEETEMWLRGWEGIANYYLACTWEVTYGYSSASHTNVPCITLLISGFFTSQYNGPLFNYWSICCHSLLLMMNDQRYIYIYMYYRQSNLADSSFHWYMLLVFWPGMPFLVKKSYVGLPLRREPFGCFCGGWAWMVILMVLVC